MNSAWGSQGDRYGFVPRCGDLLARDETGDGGFGDYAVGDAGTCVGCVPKPWFMEVYAGCGEHLLGELAVGVRVREIDESVMSLAPGEREYRGLPPFMCTQAVNAAWAWEFPTCFSASVMACLGAPALMVGSGKLGTPWECMQRA